MRLQRTARERSTNQLRFLYSIRERNNRAHVRIRTLRSCIIRDDLHWLTESLRIVRYRNTRELWKIKMTSLFDIGFKLKVRHWFPVFIEAGKQVQRYLKCSTIHN